MVQKYTLKTSPLSPVICMHRGLSPGIPENSLAAVKESLRIAREYPYFRFFIELDVRATLDGDLVVMHDADVSRTTSGQGIIEKMTLDEVNNLFLRHPALNNGNLMVSAINPCDLSVPKLDDVISLIIDANEELSIYGNPLGLALEIKPGPFLGHFRANAWSLADSFLSCASRIMPEGFPLPVPRPVSGAVRPLSSLFNQKADEGSLPPCHVFSSAGLAGARDLNSFYSDLSQSAKEHFEDLTIKGSRPTVPEVFPRIFPRKLKCMKWMNPFSVLRDRRYAQDVNSSLTPLNAEALIKLGLEEGHSWINTERPRVAAELLRTRSKVEERRSPQM